MTRNLRHDTEFRLLHVTRLIHLVYEKNTDIRGGISMARGYGYSGYIMSLLLLAMLALVLPSLLEYKFINYCYFHYKP